MAKIKDTIEEAEYLCEQPAKLTKLGNNLVWYVPMVASRQLLKKVKYVFPEVYDVNAEPLLVYHLKRPDNYFDKAYKLYRIKRGEFEYCFVPIPKMLKAVVCSKRGHNLVNCAIGFNSKKEKIIAIERWK